MKTERRHELQKNDLAAWLERNFEAVKPYSTLIACVAIAAIVFGGAYSFTASQTQGKLEVAWDDLYLALGDRQLINSQFGLGGSGVRPCTAV